MKILYFIVLFASTLFAEPLYSFKDVSINYFDWSAKTQKDLGPKDFAYLNVEGGLGYDWMDFYGFVSLENPTKSYNEESPLNQRYVAFGDLDIKLKNDFKLHIQNFYANGNAFYVNDFVIGFSYKYTNENNFWIKPFVGVHFTNDTYFDGFNGYMCGWVFNYPFKVSNANFSLSQWNEIEFSRAKSFYEDDNGNPVGDGKSYGLNGALAFWWNMNSDFTAGIQYRYAHHKLGSILYQSAYIYTFKYNF